MAFRRYNPSRAALFACVMTAHAMFWETLRAARGDYWSGWDIRDALGALSGALIYFAVFLLLQIVVTGFNRRHDDRTASNTACLISALTASVIVWGLLFAVWEGVRLSVLISMAGSLVLVLIPAALRVSAPAALILGLTPSVAGIVATLSTAHANMLSPSLRQMLTYQGFQHFVIAWGVLSLVWFMSRKRRRRAPLRMAACVVLVTLALVPLWLRDAPKESDGPNLLLITVDSLRADYCSVYEGNVPTPALDSVARRGIVFDRAYALGPWTLPSMTGLFASAFPPSLTPGASREQWVEEMQYYHVPPDVPMLAEQLREKGYATYALIANKLLDQPEGILRGFDRYAVFHSSIPARIGPLSQLPFLQEFVGRLLPHVEPIRAADTTRPLRDLASAFIRRHREQPYFLWIHFMDPHAPWDPPARFRHADGPWPLVDPSDAQWGGPQFTPDTHILELPLDQQAYVRGLYEGEIQYIDQAIGDVLATLRETGNFDDTFVCITADHGEEFWDHGQVTHGQSLYEELIRVPLLVAGPGIAPSRIDVPFSHLDLMPTLAEALDAPPAGPWRGASRLVDLTASDAVFAGRDIFAQGTYIAAPEPLRTVVRDRYKVIEGLDTHDAQLFDIDNERKPLPNHDDRKQSAIDAMNQWWEMFPATIEEVRTEQTDVPTITQERLRALGYLD